MAFAFGPSGAWPSGCWGGRRNATAGPSLRGTPAVAGGPLLGEVAPPDGGPRLLAVEGFEQDVLVRLLLDLAEGSGARASSRSGLSRIDDPQAPMQQAKRTSVYLSTRRPRDQALRG